MSREELKLVTSFEELRAGMIVVIRRCAWCGGDHRAMLVAFTPGDILRTREGFTGPTPSWNYEPTPKAHCTRSAISPDSVSESRVYRVSDGLESSGETATKKPKKRERAK